MVVILCSVIDPPKIIQSLGKSRFVVDSSSYTLATLPTKEMRLVRLIFHEHVSSLNDHRFRRAHDVSTTASGIWSRTNFNFLSLCFMEFPGFPFLCSVLFSTF